MNKKFLLGIVVTSLFFIGCSNESKEEAKKVANTTIDKVAEVTNETAQKAADVVEEVKKETAPIVEEVVESSKGVVKKAAQSAEEMKENVEKKIHDATAPAVDGKALYARCGSCHGQNGEKKALNKSSIIQGWSKDQLYKALKGYQDGSYGGAMKGVMLGQVKDLKDTELDALATYISSL